MAIFSTHLLNSIDGTHASDVEIVIYKINNNNKVVFLEDKTDSSGRMLKEFELTKEDCESAVSYTHLTLPTSDLV